MDAVVQDRYGPVGLLRVARVCDPVPQPDEVLVRVQATSVHVDVWHTITGLPYALRLMGNGARRPSTTVPGTDVAGVVVAAGTSVTRFRPGDAVMGETVRGIQWRHGGAWAELVTAPEDGLVRTPAGLTPEQAAAVGTPAVLAYQVLLDQAGFRAGQSVLVNGAAGALGLWTVQLALALGAARVVAVDRAEKLDTLRSLGVHEVVDHLTEDPTAVAPVDVVVDVASTRPFREWRRVIAHGGTYVRVGHDHYGAGMHRALGSMPSVLGLLVRAPFTPGLRLPGRSTPRLQRLEQLARLLEQGSVRPLVDRTYPLHEAAAAMAYLVSGRAVGRVVLTVPSTGSGDGPSRGAERG